MVAELSTLHGEDIVADAMPEAEQAELGLVPGNVVLRVRGEPAEDGPGEVLAEVVLGEIDPDQGIAARARGSDRIYRIDYELAEHLPISLEALRNRFLSEGEGAAPDA
jgi:hypothetical protein